MARYRESTSAELEESRDARISRRRLDRLEICANYPEQAARLRTGSNLADDPEVFKMVGRVRSECHDLKGKCGGRVQSRRRPHSPLPGTGHTRRL